MRLIVMRLLAALPTLAGVIVVTFLLTRMLPGDPAAFFAGPAATAASIEETRHRLGLDRSLPEQFIVYVEGLAHGDLGNSLTSGQAVVDDLANRLPASLELTLAALILALGLGIPLGIGAAVKPGGAVDRLCSIVSTAGQAIPTFFLGLLLVFVFYYLLDIAPAPLGRLDVIYSPPDEITGFWSVDAVLAGDWPLLGAVLAQLVLPVATLALFGLGPLARITRASMIEVLASDFIRTARAAGLPRRKILIGYALRNAVVPVLNTAGMVFSYMLGASVLVEKVFGWPGIGAYAIDAVLASDFAPVQGFILAMALLYLVLNLLIDVAAGLLDPKARLDV
jgi:ABC-type dipeptide/oligopeptide/nickel transport system permease component